MNNKKKEVERNKRLVGTRREVRDGGVTGFINLTWTDPRGPSYYMPSLSFNFFSLL